MFYLINNSGAYDKLKQELMTAFPDKSTTPSIADVDRLPFLISTNLPLVPSGQALTAYYQAVIQEGLRLGLGVSARLQRISPTQPMQLGVWTIPPGTPVGMTSIFVHRDPQIFFKPHEFIPERWIENPQLEEYLLSFSKGSRQCAGITSVHDSPAERRLCACVSD